MVVLFLCTNKNLSVYENSYGCKRRKMSQKELSSTALKITDSGKSGRNGVLKMRFTKIISANKFKLK